MTAEMFKLFPGKKAKPLKPWQIHPKFAHPSQTSQDAAISVLPVHRTLQEIVLDAISQAPMGLNDEEIATVTGLAPNTARPRRVELATKGLIESAGTRPTKSGRQAAVWTVKK